jgi:hypothetical protein
MAIGSTHRDPHSIITPDAFDVSEDLLGTPLEPPIRRLLAWPIDFAVIGFVTLVTNSFSMILGLVVAVFFMRAGFKRTPVKGSVFGRAMRASVGCLGLFIGVITAASWALFGFGFGSSGDDEDDVSTPPSVVTDMAGLPLARGLAGLAAGAIFEGVDERRVHGAASRPLGRAWIHSGLRDRPARLRSGLLGREPTGHSRPNRGHRGHS